MPAHAILIFMTGAVILGLELTASRYMSPMFGSSLYIWGAILSVTLVCLSVGYSLGGRLGERDEKPILRLLAFALISAAWIGLLPFLQEPVALLGIEAGMTMGPIVVMTLLFAPPILLLATATPLAFAANNKERHGDHAPTVMGDLFAISTVGSVAGALATAYGLIPLLGLKLTLYVLAFTLLLPIAPYVLKGEYPRLMLTVIALIATSQVFHESGRLNHLAADFRILHHTSSLYGEVTILENRDDNARILLHNGTGHNWIAGANFDQSRFPYLNVMAAHARQHGASSKDALVVGLGAGLMTKKLDAMGYRVTSVELDPVMHDMAVKYFRFDPALPTYFQDGRTFLRESAHRGEKYAVVVLDVEGGGSQPQHLLDIEAFELIDKVLDEDGILIANHLVKLAAGENQLALHQLATLRAIFPRVRAFNVYPNQSDVNLTNLVSVSGHRTPENPGFRSGIGERLFEPDTTGIRPITDNWSPSELLSIKVNQHLHENIIAWLGPGAVIPI